MKLYSNEITYENTWDKSGNFIQMKVLGIGVITSWFPMSQRFWSELYLVMFFLIV